MKILAIRGKNLASLEGFFKVDFTLEPLKSTGIFAITGNTGSGKSTLLDALCLALFDNTPRMKHAGENKVFIQDVQNETISQDDCRNILRRGTSDGYAEADFVALNGDIFRSTWMVRRARDKANGKLQPSEIRLKNLSTNMEEQGGKKELLLKITQLIGLSFEQFTRAVLLAQGDFATFLKAKKDEKAELLEKLTGTDIYSRISMVIYEKSKSVENDYRLLQERIKEIALLPEEETATYHTEKQQVTETVETLKTTSNTLREKIKWLQQETTLKNDVASSENALQAATEAILAAQSRYDNMERIDTVQEIRDVFIQFQHDSRQLDINRIATEKQKTELSEKNDHSIKIQTALSALDQQKNNFEQEAARIEPDIIKARELETKISEAKNNETEIKKDLEAIRLSKERIERNIQTTQSDILDGEKKLHQLQVWFQEHEKERNIIPDINLIINLLNDAAASQKQQKEIKETLRQRETELNVAVEALSVLHQESERLSRLLPAEIALLRNSLEEGKPCPVCGSLHHPLHEPAVEQSLQEAELTRAKEKNKANIDTSNSKIEALKNETLRLNTIETNLESHLKQTLQKVQQYLTGLECKELSFETGHLQQFLQKTAEQWNDNSLKITQQETAISNKKTQLQHEQNSLSEAIPTLNTKTAKHAEMFQFIEKLQQERSLLLNGKPVNEVVTYYASTRSALDEKIKRGVDAKEKTLKEVAALTGSIERINDELNRLSSQCTSAKTTIEKWISEKNETITETQLAEIFSIDMAWIRTEKEALNKLKEQKTTAQATRSERLNNLIKHQEAKIKPENQDETIGFLSEQLAHNEQLFEDSIKRITEINAIFENHAKEKERHNALENERRQKESLVENWKKLNDLFGSATGAKFKEQAQGYTLDALLHYSNKHLTTLSKRYELQRIPESLSLQVIDLDMLGEIRTVHSLSGGESFLISLALALGLSSLSSNRMKIESLFIDEGFGSLDSETLGTAMDALECLHAQGKKIGLISHVAEVTERIATQIRVVKKLNGQSAVEVV